MSKSQALIVGGTTGMGKATAQLLLKQGIEVIIVGRADKNLEVVQKELSTFGSVKTVALNLLDIQAVKAFSEKEGHCQVPQLLRLPDGYGLGFWVSRQRMIKDEIDPIRKSHGA